MEQHVAAARAMVNPSTDSATRSAASNFLEQWMGTADAWEGFLSWLRLFQNADRNNPEVQGVHLLCLTLLQSKVRKEIHTSVTETMILQSIRSELWSLLKTSQDPVIGPLCSTLCSLSVRLGHLKELIQLCQTSSSMLPQVSLRILTSTPLELESFSNISDRQFRDASDEHIATVIDIIRRALLTPGIAVPALQALSAWAGFNITIEHLHMPSMAGGEPLLPILMEILSQPHPADETLLDAASHALTEALLVPTNERTPTREAAVQIMINGVSHGFIAAPFAFCTSERWDDAAHSLATLICTLVSEEIDDICSMPAEPCLSLLLQIQSHPHIPVSLTVLECWLNAQQVSVEDRHDNWKSPLFLKVTEGLVARVAYPQSFKDWEEEVELDNQEFSELRRMVSDVLISSYFLLRVQYLQQISAIISSATTEQWHQTESALFCLGCVCRVVCDRIKAKGTNNSLVDDRNETTRNLMRLVEHFCGRADAVEFAARQHPLVLAAIANFVGLYAPVWKEQCSTEALMQLLAYLCSAISVSPVVVVASKAIKLVLIGCATRLMEVPNIDLRLREMMDMSLATENQEGMSMIAEGLTRLVVQLPGTNKVQQSMGNLMTPLMDNATRTLAIYSSNGSAAQTILAMESLTKYLHVLQIVVKFCETPEGGVSPMAAIVPSLCPFLETVATNAGQNEGILHEVLAIHSRLLSNAPELVIPRFSDTVKFVVAAFGSTKHPSALDYIAGAVEAFSPITAENAESFSRLLSHVAEITCTYVINETNPENCTQLIRAFFEMCHRYVLFCPAALIGGQHFSSIVAVAVSCLTACNGEKESTRAALNFLTQIFGWRLLRVPVESMSFLETHAAIADEELRRHGENVTRICINGLAGESPQMLWPPLSDCLFAIVTQVTQTNTGSPEDNTAAQRWVYEALVYCKCNTINPKISQQITHLLFEFARNARKSKPKAKMLLTDFAKICKGETGLDALVSYSIE